MMRDRDRCRSGWRRALLALALAPAAGCMSVPSRYQTPPREYPAKFQAASVRSVSRLKGPVATAERANLIAARVGLGILGQSLDDRFSDLSEEFLFAKLLESTKCVSRVDVIDRSDVRPPSVLRIELESSSRPAPGILDWALLLTEAMTLVYVIGAPLSVPVDGVATVRIFADAGPPQVLEVTSRLRYVSNFYRPEDRPMAASLSRAMALRDLADQAAELLCGKAR